MRKALSRAVMLAALVGTMPALAAEDCAGIAARAVAAWRAKTVVSGLAGIDAATAACVQKTLVQDLAPDAGAPVGYKVGLTGKAMQERLGVDHPVSGVLLEGMLFRRSGGWTIYPPLKGGRTDVIFDNQPVPADFAARPIVEADLVVVIGDAGVSQARTPAEVLAHLSAIRPFIELADDNTFVQRRHARELLRSLIEEDIRWFTESDIGIADDPELLTLMRDAGCREVLIGLESPTARGIAGVELRRDWKRTRFGDYLGAIERIQSHGIAVNGCFVLGLDGDGPEVFDAVEAFVRESGQFDVQITVMTAFPGTPLYERLLAEGRLLEPTAWDRCSLFDVNFRPRNMSVEALQDGLLTLGRRLYTDDERRARRNRFYDHRRRYIRRQREQTGRRTA